MKKYSIALLGIFYIAAGINHFIHPDFYLPLIPGYLPAPKQINIISGIAEILLGAGVLYPKTRYNSCAGIILMLLCFIPAHIWFIQKNGCLGVMCLPVWIAWLRLLLIHPLLIGWAYVCRKQAKQVRLNHA